MRIAQTPTALSAATFRFVFVTSTLSWDFDRHENSIRPSYRHHDLIRPYCYFGRPGFPLLISGLRFGNRAGYEGCAVNPICQLGCSTARTLFLLLLCTRSWMYWYWPWRAMAASMGKGGQNIQVRSLPLAWQNWSGYQGIYSTVTQQRTIILGSGRL